MISKNDQRPARKCVSPEIRIESWTLVDQNRRCLQASSDRRHDGCAARRALEKRTVAGLSDAKRITSTEGRLEDRAVKSDLADGEARNEGRNHRSFG